MREARLSVHGLCCPQRDSAASVVQVGAGQVGARAGGGQGRRGPGQVGTQGRRGPRAGGGRGRRGPRAGGDPGQVGVRTRILRQKESLEAARPLRHEQSFPEPGALSHVCPRGARWAGAANRSQIAAMLLMGPRGAVRPAWP